MALLTQFKFKNMAIDSIENNDLAALAPSRLGNKSFINDDRYSNLFGSKKKANAQSAADTAAGLADMKTRYPVESIEIGDCVTVNVWIDKISAEIENDLSKNLLPSTIEQYVNPKRDVLSVLKGKLAEFDCQGKKEAADTAAQQKNTMDVLATVANTPPPLIPVDAAAQSAANTNKYITYGVAGVILAIGVVILLKK